MFLFVEASDISPLDNLSPKNSEKDHTLVPQTASEYLLRCQRSPFTQSVNSPLSHIGQNSRIYRIEDRRRQHVHSFTYNINTRSH